MVLNINAKQAWGVIAAGVLAYELACNEGELLSEGVDDWMATKPILTRTLIAALALHQGCLRIVIRPYLQILPP